MGDCREMRFFEQPAVETRRHKSEREHHFLDIKAKTAAAVRTTARDTLRSSGSERDRRHLALAEAGYGVMHLVNNGCDVDIARRIVLGETS